MPDPTLLPDDPIFIRRTMGALRMRYVNVPAEVEDRGTHYATSFVGIFRGIQRSWNVEIWPNQRISSDWVNYVYSRYQPDGPGLICISRSRADIQQLTGHDKLKSQVFCVTLDEFEADGVHVETDREFPEDTVSIDHDTPLYIETVKMISSVKDALESSNSIEIRWGVRQRLAAEIKAGLALLEASEVRLASLKVTVVQALSFIAKVCTTAVVGDMAKRAATKLIELLFN